jgi:hypothetical protein
MSIEPSTGIGLCGQYHRCRNVPDLCQLKIWWGKCNILKKSTVSLSRMVPVSMQLELDHFKVTQLYHQGGLHPAFRLGRFLEKRYQ